MSASSGQTHASVASSEPAVADPVPDGLPIAAPVASTRTLIIAIELGVLGDYLMRANGLGANLTLWCWALLIAAAMVAGASGVAMDRRRIALLAAAGFFAAVPAWRSSEEIIFFSGVAVLTLLVLSAWTAGAPGIVLLDRTVGSYIRAAWTGAVHVILGAVPLLAAEARARSEIRNTYRRPLGAALRGLAISIPIVLVLGTLLTKADPAYEALVTDLLYWDAGTIASHFALAAVFTWLAAAYLVASVRWGRVDGTGRTLLRLGVIEGATVLGVVNLLFLSFVLVQLRYLFGGTEHVLATAGLTYAEYARRGFFELVTVTALTLPLLVGVTASVQPESTMERRIHRVLTAALVVLLLALVASAVGRMRLYQAEYGWTLPRVHASVLMMWICVSILWFAATVLRADARRFAFGVVTSGLVLLGGLVTVNPAALVVRANAARVAAGGDFDGGHAASLGADGVPELLRALPVVAPMLDLEGRCAIHQAVERAQRRPPEDQSNDWRVWNLSRMRANAAVERRTATTTRVLGESPCAELAAVTRANRVGAPTPTGPPR